MTYDDLPALLTLMTGDEKHDASSTSTLDAIWVLYDQVLRVRPDTVDDPGRDRFLLSKGHGPMAYYAVLAAHGFLTADDLRGFAGFDSPLGQHPDRTLAPGVEIGAGSLGHGLGLGVGMALGLPAGSDAHVVVLVGDAELDEGSNWEAVQFAGRAALGRLMCVVIDNHSATWGWPGGVGARFAAEGWTASWVSGRDHHELLAGYRAATVGRPHVVVADVEAQGSAA